MTAKLALSMAATSPTPDCRVLISILPGGQDIPLWAGPTEMFEHLKIQGAHLNAAYIILIWLQEGWNFYSVYMKLELRFLLMTAKANFSTNSWLWLNVTPSKQLKGYSKSGKHIESTTNADRSLDKIVIWSMLYKFRYLSHFVIYNIF